MLYYENLDNFMIQILHNSQSDNYIKLKKKFTSNYFPWYFNNNVAREEFNTEDNVFYFGHTLYTRPEVSGFSQPASENFQLALTTMQEILTENNYDSSKYFLLRMNVNCTLPSDTVQFSTRHLDHNFDHMNFLLYLTGNGGSTFVDKGIMDWEENKPEEDQAILFSGEHYIQLPKRGRRIVLIATIMFHS